MRWPEMEIKKDGTWRYCPPHEWARVVDESPEVWVTPRGISVVCQLLDGHEVCDARVKR